MATQPDDRPNGTGRLDRIEALLEDTAELQKQNTRGLAETKQLIEGMAEQQKQNTQGLAETRQLIEGMAEQQKQNTQGLAETGRRIDGIDERLDRISESYAQTRELLDDIAARQDRNERGVGRNKKANRGFGKRRRRHRRNRSDACGGSNCAPLTRPIWSANSGRCLRPEMKEHDFIAKWRASELKERSAAQEHFIDLCRLLDEPTPAEDDPSGQRYCFERGARKDSGGSGWADVWKRHCFAWEYKGPHKDLDAAFNQLRQYALALENPPLLIVSDMVRFRIHTNWTNSVSVVHEFTLEDLADGAVRDKLKWAMSDPERLRPGESRQSLTERAATSFAGLAQSLRARGHEPQEVAHFVNRLVFCMFAEDVGLLPNEMFTRMLDHARRHPSEFAEMARELFGKMSTGGRVGFETVDWFNGGLFDDDAALPLKRAEIETTLEAAALDWSEIDPSIFGHPLRTRPGPGETRPARRALHRPRQDHADRRAGRRAPLAQGVGSGARRDRAAAGARRRCRCARSKDPLARARRKAAERIPRPPARLPPCSTPPAAPATSFTSPCTP